MPDTIPDAALWGGGSYLERILYQPATNLADYFSDPVDILGATVDLYARDDTTGQAARPVGAHEITAEWTDTQATWNRRQAGVAWATPGGDFSAQPTAVNPNVTGQPGYRYFMVTSAVRAWVTRERPQRGVVLKYENEAGGPLIYFSRLGTFSYPTRYLVSWEPLQALRDPYRYQSVELGEHRRASVNVASGTLSLRERDLHVTGTGLDAAFDRTYDSRAPGVDSMGMRWFAWPGSYERLTIYPDGVQWIGGPEVFLNFARNADGSFTAAPGYRATLTQAPDASYALTRQDDGTVYHFSASGYPADVTDRNGNRISFGYVYNAGMNRYDMVSMTDTQGRVTTFERNAGGGRGMVSKVTDPAGRVWSYAYLAEGTFGIPLLASVTDPAGKVTRYEWQTPGDYLTKITDPDGAVTTSATRWCPTAAVIRPRPRAPHD